MSLGIKRITPIIFVLIFCGIVFFTINTEDQQKFEKNLTNASLGTNETNALYEKNFTNALHGTNETSPIPTPSSVIYLTNFGIQGDGSDETTKLKIAFNYVRSHSIKTIIFPAGKTIGITNYIETPENIELAGNGCTIRLMNNAKIDHENSFFYIHAGDYAHDLIFDGNMDNQGGSATNGVMVYSNVRFENNEVKNVGAYSVSTYTGDNIVISNNTIHDSWQYGIATSGEGFPQVSDYSNNITITNNIIYNCGEVGIKLRQNTNSLISGNIITIPNSGKRASGIRLYSFDGTNKYHRILNNTISGSGLGYDIGIDSDDKDNTDIDIFLNQISNVWVGIRIRFDSGNVSSNAITEARYAGIWVNGNNNKISQNVLTNAIVIMNDEIITGNFPTDNIIKNNSSTGDNQEQLSS
jgi:parallel beta-helix repeat protein